MNVATVFPCLHVRRWKLWSFPNGCWARGRNIHFASMLPGKMDVKWMLGPEMDVHCTFILHPFSDSPKNRGPILRPFCSLPPQGEREEEEEARSGHGSQARLPIHRRYPLPAIMSEHMAA